MSFFDLSIPYTEKSGAPNARSRRDARLQTAARAMELGYTAVAYDLPFRGVLSDADRCQIAPFSAQSFLESSPGASMPAFTTAVSLHRELLSVPRASPFRQYTRITVSVDSAAAASVLNSGNRLLRSYDVVAARPVNQVAFDQACAASEVDIISLNFSQKLPYRLKLPMVQAAIKRGVYFEISYSHLIADGHARRQILSEAKRLVEWTRGKSLILSGSATSLNEIRGPHDVANLSTVLLGLSMERAKAAISKNCRSLVLSALRKKDCYFKEAIRIERILPEEVDSKGNWFKNWNGWDPLSTEKDNLPSLNDMAKLFSAASTHSRTQNSVGFTSSVSGMASNSPLLPCANKHGHINIDRVPVEASVLLSNSVSLDFTPVSRMASYSPLLPCAKKHGHNNVNGVPEEASVMVANSASNAANNVPELCSDENCMAIDAFENTSCTEAASISCIVENTDETDAALIFTESPEDVVNLLGCSSVGTRDQMSNTIITLEDHYLEKMTNSEEKNSSLIDVQINRNPDMMEVLPYGDSTSKNLDEIGGQRQLETSIFNDIQVNIEQVIQHDSTTEVESNTVKLLDDSSKLEMKVQTSILTKINGKTKILSTTEIPDSGVLLDDTLTRTKKNYFSAEINSSLEKAELEGQSIQRPVTSDGVNNGSLHEYGKYSRFRRKSNQKSYLLPVKNLCKSMFFKKKTRRSRRGPRFLYG